MAALACSGVSGCEESELVAGVLVAAGAAHATEKHTAAMIK
jgi:hypothetical protein